MTRNKAFLGIGALLAAVALAAGGLLTMGWGIAAAQAPTAQTPLAGPHPVRVIGKVDSVAANSLTLTTPRFGQVTANAGSDTWIVVMKNGKATQGSLSDIQTGKPVAVAGMTSDNKTIDARVVSQSPGVAAVAWARGHAILGALGRRIAEHLAGGTVKSVSANTLTITNPRGQDIVVNTTDSTVVLNDGFQSAGSVQVGDKVTVLGKPEKAQNNGTTTPANQPRTITAWALRVDNPGTKLVIGKVDSVSGNTVTVKGVGHPQGIAITVDNSTGYKSVTVGTNKSISVSNAAQSDLQVGSRVAIEGVTGSDGKSLVAKAVLILPQKANTTPTTAP